MKRVVVFRRTHSIKNKTPFTFDIKFSQIDGFDNEMNRVILPEDSFSISPNLYTY